MILVVGQQARLVFLAAQAGIDPAALVSVNWTQQGPPDAVRLTPPDHVEALAVGTGAFTCTASAGANERMTYKFTIDVVAAEPALPVTVPVMLEPLA